MNIRLDYTAGYPVRRKDWALFLDVDGTLLEIATGPDVVHVSARARHALQIAMDREDGAVALVSGRAITDLDRLFAPLRLPAAGLHGLERRDAIGRSSSLQVAPRLLDAARERIAPLLAAHRGLKLEDKRFSLAVHFRMAPSLEQPVRAMLEELAAAMQPDFHVQTAKYCMELKPARCSKGAAIRAFMREAPFAGRLPVFVGDDDTDEDGFEAVNALGGLSIRVGHHPETAARWQVANVNAVLRWLHMPGEPLARPVLR